MVLLLEEKKFIKLFDNIQLQGYNSKLKLFLFKCKFILSFNDKDVLGLNGNVFFKNIVIFYVFVFIKVIE